MNNTINCLVVDDEPVARRIVVNYIGHLPFLKMGGECGNALEAKERLLEGGVDLLFLDIHMPVLNGIGFLKTLQNPPQVIFTTAYQEYAVNAFDLAACDYLLKPFSLERFIIAVDRAKAKLYPSLKPPAGPAGAAGQGCLMIKHEGKISKVFYTDCMYAEAQANYTKVVTANKEMLTKIPFADFAALLPEALFIRVHRSFVVNRAAINYIEGNRVIIGRDEIPIGASYKDAFFKAFGLK